MRVYLWAAGGGGGGHRNNQADGGDGGGGAAVDAFVLVAGGQQLTVMVGESRACVSSTISGFSYGGGASCGGKINQRTAGYGARRLIRRPIKPTSRLFLVVFRRSG